ncbi:hypothetical protein GWK16_01225 [Roseomonas sp. JC162]|uniref:Uncharacterized protein n=1 Tax=Neoroseomonas marina TaxID=1232220 RepID=A0A848E5Z3_9PROT|nr:hypothetical protein [Neoroseomonas marina]NMJ39844.1 hypothetical protein [Neoroseomonas marina]
MRRSFLLLLATLPLPACTVVPFAPQGAAQRIAGLTVAADQAAGRMVDHLGQRERSEIDQAASLRYAAGGAPNTNLPRPATPVAGAVLDPGMDLMVLETRRLAALAAGAAPTEGQDGALAFSRVQDALAGLRAAPARWPSDAVRRRGLEGFRVLSEPAPQGMDAAGLAAARQGAVEDATTLMQALVGFDARSGLRGVLAQRHEAWQAAQRGVLASGRTLSPAERMALWNRVQAALAADGPDLPAAELVRLFAALPPAHAAAGAGDAAGAASFEAALARFQGVLAQAR